MSRKALAALAFAALVAAAAVAWHFASEPKPQWAPRPPPPQPSGLLPYQHTFRELSAEDQQVYFAVRSAMATAERVRATTKKWPEPAGLAGEGLPGFDERYEWSKRESGLYVSYLGLPKQGGTRFLVLIIEPDPKQLKLPNEPPPPNDIEHHTLADGTPVHLTVWTQPNEGPVPPSVVAFPVADGWTERR